VENRYNITCKINEVLEIGMLDSPPAASPAAAVQQGWRILKYVDIILKDNNPTAAIELLMAGLKFVGSHQFHLAWKAMELCLQFRDYDRLQQLLTVSVETKIPGHLVAEIAQLIAQRKLGNGEDVSTELSIIKSHCLNRRTVRFIRGAGEPTYEPTPTYRVFDGEIGAAICPPSYFRPRTPEKLQGGVTFLAERELSRPRLDLLEFSDCDYYYNGNEFLIANAGGEVASSTLHSDYTYKLYQEHLASTNVLHLDQIAIVQDLASPHNYCHWVCDWLPRVLTMREHLRGEIAVPFGEPLSKYQTEFLAFVPDVRAFHFPRQTVIRAKKIQLLTSSADMRHPAYFAHPEMLATLRRHYREVEPVKGLDNVYISRASTPRRRLLNERELQAALAAEGFLIVEPEKLSVSEQIAIFKGARCLVGTHGAGLVNLVFAENCRKLVEIFPPTYGTFAYQMIADALGVNYSYYCQADARPMDLDAQYQDFSIPLASSLELILKACA
jgi:capsular polysaccharide biosynthesis protein